MRWLFGLGPGPMVLLRPTRKPQRYRGPGLEGSDPADRIQDSVYYPVAIFN
jgi:hypothetical protein